LNEFVQQALPILGTHLRAQKIRSQFDRQFGGLLTEACPTPADLLIDDRGRIVLNPLRSRPRVGKDLLGLALGALAGTHTDILEFYVQLRELGFQARVMLLGALL